MTTFADSVQELSTTIGTGSLVLSGVAADSATRTFGSKHASGDKVRYRAEKGAQWEVGVGTLVDATHISRDVILASSSGDSIVTFLDGTMTVSEVLSSYDIMRFAGLENDVITTVSDPTKVNLFLEDGTAKPKRMTMANFLTLFGTTPSQMTALADLSKLIGVDSAGNLGTVSQALAASFTGGSGGTADTTAPTMNGSLTSSNVSASAFTLNWSAASDAVGVTGYEVSRDGGTTYTNAGNVLTYAYTGLAASTAYAARVRAYDAAGNKATSLSLTVTTAAASGDTTAPSMSGSLTTSNVTATGYTMNWTAGTDNVAVTGYETSTDGGTSWSDAGNVTSRAITGAVASTTYNLRVRAYDAAGNRSNVLSATVTTSASGPTYSTVMYSDGALKTTSIDGTTPTDVYGNLKRFTNAKSFTGGYGGYFTSTPIPPADASGNKYYSGWVKQGDTPAIVTAAANANNSGSVNGLTPAGTGDNGYNVSNMWVATGAGTVVMEFWVKPSDGAFFKMGSVTVVNA